jgi:hypothetical protein
MRHHFCDVVIQHRDFIPQLLTLGPAHMGIRLESGLAAMERPLPGK